MWTVGHLQRTICEETFLNRLLKDSNLIQVLQKYKDPCDLKHSQQIYNLQFSFMFAYLRAIV